jgi:CheY-like chemotaxis protein
MLSSISNEDTDIKHEYFSCENVTNVEKYPILLAEDNYDDIIITKRALKKGLIQNKLYTANNGEEALEFLYKRGKFVDAPRPFLILLDLNMPRVNGFDVLKIIKQDSELKNIPVIVLTTSNRDKDIQLAYKLGCNSYIVKPVDYGKFVEAMKIIQKYWILLCKTPSQY